MKKTIFALALASLSMGAFAATNGYTVEVGTSLHQERYEEFADGEKLMQEKADMVGVKASISRQLTSVGAIKASLEYAHGDADYTGAYWGDAYGSLKVPGLSRHLFEVSGTYTHHFAEAAGIDVVGGLAYRRLQDNLQEAGAGGYERVNEMYYAIAGVERAFKVEGWTVKPGVHYKLPLHARQHSDLLGGVTVKQKHGYGTELFAQVTPAGSTLTITPFYRHWSIKDSEISADGLYEPRNKTREVGVAVSVRF